MTQPDPFQTLMQTSLHAIEDPDRLDDILASLSDRADQHWYLSDLNADLPTTPAPEEDVQEFIVRADVLIQRSRESGQAPRLEVDDLIKPTFIRLRNGATADGDTHEQWIMSLAQPSLSSDSTSAEPPSETQTLSDDHAETSPDTTRETGYMDQFDGKLIAMRKWEDLDELWASIHGSASDGYYLYTIGKTPPTEPADSQAVHRFLLDADAMLRQEHKENYCGIVYADSKTAPTFVKIYDPHNLGMVCGSSGVRTLPGWTISKTRPTELTPEEKSEPHPRGFMRWKGLFGRK